MEISSPIKESSEKSKHRRVKSKASEMVPEKHLTQSMSEIKVNDDSKVMPSPVKTEVRQGRVRDKSTTKVINHEK